ncbi:MAG: hypothetical protein HLUCCA04_11060 [Oceanicaulis sp. HLUCCA04]|nr:MAG: hypothetical protein HLUCCA04_11060 [Oceanicaulis sp. HLUCCA04]
MSPKPPIALEDRALSGARLTSPSAGRNRDVIARTLSEILRPGARVLEIASGTGEHALACVRARSDIGWQPSDPDAASRASIDDWAREAEGRIAPALDLDTTVADWQDAVSGPVTSVFCANMIHIAPWEAAIGLVEGCSALLKEGGQLIFYGPFLEGSGSAASNLDFDASLKSRDPRWGVRALEEVQALAARHGFALKQRIAMPASNLTLIFEKGAS